MQKEMQRVLERTRTGIACAVLIALLSGVACTPPTPEAAREQFMERGYAPDARGFVAAAYKGHAEVVELYVIAGMPLNETNGEGMTPLIAAASRGHEDAVDVLVEAGADLDKQDRRGMTALMRAAHEGHTEVVANLLKAGADANIRDRTSRTALSWARKQGHDRIVAYLEGVGAVR